MKASDRSSGRVEPARPYPAHISPDDNGSLTPVTSFAHTDRPATAVYVASLPARLSPRDVAIVRDLGRVRVLTGRQLERLHFHDLGQHNRDRARRRVLGRLISLSVITTLERSIGGVRAGSAGLVYTLDAAGQRLLRQLDGEGQKSVRRPWTPGVLFLNHTLDVAELYVQLREAERAGQCELSAFRAEPACWQRTASLGTIKPDAYALVAAGEVEDAWWLEVDRGTESPGTLRRKLSLYLLAAQAGVTGPDGIVPRVLVTVPNERRLDVVRNITDSLGSNAQRLIFVTLHERAVPFMVEVLRE
jgi:Replication-relaxation